MQKFASESLILFLLLAIAYVVAGVLYMRATRRFIKIVTRYGNMGSQTIETQKIARIAIKLWLPATLSLIFGGLFLGIFLCYLLFIKPF